MNNMQNVKATFAAKLEPKWIAYGSKIEDRLLSNDILLPRK
jgi:hypothetical protein